MSTTPQIESKKKSTSWLDTITSTGKSVFNWATGIIMPFATQFALISICLSVASDQEKQALFNLIAAQFGKSSQRSNFGIAAGVLDKK